MNTDCEMRLRGIKTGEDGDLLIENGGVVTGDTTVQTVEAVLLTMRGEWKEFPLLGGEAAAHLGGTADVMWPGEVRGMLRACGVEARRVKVEDNNITVE